METSCGVDASCGVETVLAASVFSRSPNGFSSSSFFAVACLGADLLAVLEVDVDVDVAAGCSSLPSESSSASRSSAALRLMLVGLRTVMVGGSSKG